MSEANPAGMSYEVFQCLFEGCGIQNRPDIQQTLKRQFNLDSQKLPLNISTETYVTVLKYLRQVLFGHKNDDESYIALGEAIVKGYLQGPLGKVNAVAAGVLGPAGSVQLMINANLRLVPGLSYEIVELKKGYFCYKVSNGDAPPGVMGGVVKAVMALAGAQNLKVIWQDTPEHIATYIITWEEK